jgi:drug/metabolite transporter (DMT)-like permease
MKPAAIQSMTLQHRIKPSAMGGLVLLIAALSCFAVLDTTTKVVTASVPLLMALWVLFLVQTLAAGAYVLLMRDRASLKTTHIGLHLTRGALMLTVQMLAFFSLHYLPVGEFTAMAMTTPLLVTLLASRFLGEHVSVFRLILVAGGLAGTLVIVRPGSNALGWAMLLPLALVLVNTAFQLLASKMARTEDAVTTLFYTCLTALVLTSLPLAWVWVPVSSMSLWLGLLFMGIAAAGGNLLFILAFERAPAATLMPYMYLQIGFGILGGWLMFDHVPDFWALVGMGLVAACGVAGGLLTLYEMRARRSDLTAGLKHEPARGPTLAQPILIPIKPTNT